MKQLMRHMLFLLLLVSGLNSFAQIGKETVVKEGGRRKLTKSEVRFMRGEVDSIKKNLNRMILFEKQLRQRNYYLNEKTALVEELIAVIQSLKQSLEVVELTVADVKDIFGKPSYKSPVVLIYEIETYKSNCPFMQITFNMKQNEVYKLDYKITDCQRWK
jgi:hypothetical protein